MTGTKAREEADGTQPPGEQTAARSGPVSPDAGPDDATGRPDAADAAHLADGDETQDDAPPQDQDDPDENNEPWPDAPALQMSPAEKRKHRRIIRASRPVGGPWLFVTVLFLGFAVVFGGLALTGKPVRLPVWMVAEAEARINRGLAELAGPAGAAGAIVSIGGAVVLVDREDWTPKLLIEDLRLVQPGGATILNLPEARFTIDPTALLQGEFRLSSVRLVGGQIAMRRLSDGRFDLALGGQMPALTFDTLAAMVDAADAAFGSPTLSSLQKIEAEALTLRLQDQRANRVWDMGDGRMTVERRENGLAAELGLSLVGGGATPAQARLTIVTDSADAQARIGITVDRVTASDIALQAPGLAWLGLLDSEVSGEFATTFDRAGRVASLEATLTLGKGALQPGTGVPPVRFDRAVLSFAFDPARERVELRELDVESPTLRLKATGHADLPGVRKGPPDTALAQISIRQLRVDPAGLFEAPAEFAGGELDLRLRLRPFSVEIGQATLIDGGRRLSASGKIVAEPSGWRVAIDVALDKIDHDRLVSLWPLRLVPKTRDWLERNLQEGTLSHVRAGLRSEPGQEPKIAMSYDFSGAGVRFMPTLPPVEQGHGYAVLEGRRYTVVLESGQVTPPQGGPLDVSGSVFVVPDVTQFPSIGEVTLKSKGSLTGTLALLDEAPFRFLSKAGQAVDMGDGLVVAKASLSLPLVGKATPEQINWQAAGTVSNFRSTRLVPGREVASAELAFSANKGELRISGPGTLDGVPFEGTYLQALGPGSDGSASVKGNMEVSQSASDKLRLGLPGKLMSGVGRADVEIDFRRGTAPKLQLVSGLRGLGLSIPELGWSKPKAAKGNLSVTATMTSPVSISRMSLQAAGLDAQGTVSLRKDGSLGEFRLSRLRVGDWLDAQALLTGQGSRRTPAVALTGGVLDLRRMPEGGGSARGGGALALSLDRIVLTETISLRNVQARLATQGGISGGFTARVNGGAVIDGTLSPGAKGSTIQVTSGNGGAVLSSSGIFPDARGGTLEMTLVPQASGYTGKAAIHNVRVRNTPVIAELINAISVVGLLDQLNGTGLLFNAADAEFRVTPNAVEITRGSAVGASLGVSLAGVYDARKGALDMQGVISPIYLVNGIGAIFTRRGEGLFGFNYRLRGTPANPQVTVNPLSILTPGMFRELFRRPPPKIDGNG